MTSKAKRRKQPVTVAAVPWDQGATGPANQADLVTEERGEADLSTGKRINPNGIFGKRRMPMVERMQRQGRLTRPQVVAAQRLYSAWAGQPTRDPLAALGDRVDGTSGADPNVSRIDQKRELFILKARVPLLSWPVVEHVVINDLPIRGMVGCSRPEAFAAQLAKLVAGLDALG